MKSFFTILIFICCCLTIKGQTNRISYVSQKRDTLLLPNNDIGKIIFSVWKNELQKPIILLVDEKVINKLNETYFLNLKQNNSNIKQFNDSAIVKRKQI
jgi:hypothetical protein